MIPNMSEIASNSKDGDNGTKSNSEEEGKHEKMTSSNSVSLIVSNLNSSKEAVGVVVISKDSKTILNDIEELDLSSDVRFTEMQPLNNGEPTADLILEEAKMPTSKWKDQETSLVQRHADQESLKSEEHSVILALEEDEKGCIDSIKRVFPSVLIDVFLPTLDTYCDLSLIIPWLIASHYNFAGSMAVSLVLNFVATAVKWNRLEKAPNKRLSWILLILQVWPQFKALRTIKMIYNREQGAEVRKKKLLQEIGCNEAILEALPSIFIMTCIWIPSLCLACSNGYGGPKLYDCESGNFTEYAIRMSGSKDHEQIKEYFSYVDDGILEVENYCAVFGSYNDMVWFFITYAISIISGGIGVTKVFQSGPCQLLKCDAPLMGMWSFKFVSCFLSILCTIVGKCLLANVLIGLGDGSRIDRMTRVDAFFIFFCLNALPNMLLAIISLICAIGFNKTLFKVVIGYPVFLIIPIITPFVIGAKTMKCCSQETSRVSHSELGVSKKLSLINVLISFSMLFVSSISPYLIFSNFKDPYVASSKTQPISYMFLISCLPVCMVGMTFSCCTIFHTTFCCCPSLQDSTNSFKKVSVDGLLLDSEDTKSLFIRKPRKS